MKENLFFKDLPIYYINLEQDIEKKERLEKSFKDYGIEDYRRVEAFHGKNDRLSAIQSDGQVPLSYPQIGIIFSYIRLMKKFLDSNDNYIVMCDDDVDFYNSTKMNFNFYETLKYHNPEFYNLKIVTLDLPHYSPPTNVLHKAAEVTYGQATLINRKWAEYFLKKYNVFDKKISKDFIINVAEYKENLNGSNSNWIHPAMDAISFDEHAYVWRIFSCFHQNETSVGVHTLLDADYISFINSSTNQKVLDEVTNKLDKVTIDAFKA